MHCFIFILFILCANSADPDQMLRSVASDLGLHCLPRSLKRDARQIWVNFWLMAQSRKPHRLEFSF